MIKKTFSILLICFVSIVLFSSVSAQPVSMNPSDLFIEGNINDLIIEQVVITNNENTSIEVTIEYEGDNDVFIPNNVIQIPALSTRTINVGFILEHEEIGWLKYTVGSSVISQLVILEIEKVDPSLFVFPNSPKAGSSIAFMITSGDIMDAHGFLFCSDTGNIYPINIVDGIGTLTLDDNETGDAVARITGDGMNPLFANFTISEDASQNNNNGNGNNNGQTVFTVNVPSDVFVDETKDVTILDGTSPVPYENILVATPSGESYTWQTNSFGKWAIHFNKVGTWTVSVLSNGQLISSSVNCLKKDGDVFLQTDNPLMNSDVFVNVFDDAVIKVEGPDGFVKTGMEMGGSFSFKPDRVGTHVVKAESDTITGLTSFDVKYKPRIVFTSISGSSMGFTGQLGKTYYVKLLDENNDMIEIDTVIDIKHNSNMYGSPNEVSLVGGYGSWTPMKTGSYSISFQGSGFYDTVQSSVMISKTSDEFQFNFTLIAFFVVLLVVAILMLRKGPPEFWRKKFSSWKQNRKVGKEAKTPE